VLLLGVVGCAQSEPVDDRLAALDPKALVPVSGVVTINGKPRHTVVVTFLPPHGPALASAETDEDGKYVLRSMGGPGALPGDYKVSISYLLSDKGEPQGIAARTAFNQGPGMLSAKEQLPREYSDLGRTILSRTVGPQGGHFDFDVPASIPFEAQEAAEKGEAQGKSSGNEKPSETKAGGGKSAEPKAAEKKPG
jgi:hypothetical protein